ncbi:3-methyladenine DNA glycosylase [Helicobacter enhydrae]|uniref:3-methyladenine DNA glycosylase n=1 Tax=Helicobacter enhydrae TaxID=222136 RepID=UPI0019004A88|nr:3-methyladenine DNA glycosylase [Helicobacter enhydrae]
MLNSFELFTFLKSQNLLHSSPSWWWHKVGTFEVIVGAILTQNTRWENVEKSLQKLQEAQILIGENQQDLINFANIDSALLESLIASSGFARQKSKRLITLCQEILRNFGSFESFVESVDAEWLIAQKGIGRETRDSILNYACQREVMVVDQYSYRLLLKCGYEIEEYEALQSWYAEGVLENLDKIIRLYDFPISLAQIYARFHGKIVEFAKKNNGFKKDFELEF